MHAVAKFRSRKGGSIDCHCALVQRGVIQKHVERDAGVTPVKSADYLAPNSREENAHPESFKQSPGQSATTRKP